MSIIFILLLLSSYTSSVFSADSDTDESTLLKIKEQLGDTTPLTSSWVAGTGFCRFQPPCRSPSYCPLPTLNCSSTGRVLYLRLTSSNDTVVFPNPYAFAPFPDAICNLTELEYLFIYNMPGLYGSIPSCINKLSNLQRLEIVDTPLSGPVPDFLNHKNLTQIILWGNKLSGPIPQSLSTIPNLRYLDLSGNNLTGTIPHGLVHGPNAILLLNDNNLSGELSKCFQWEDFAYINLARNRLSGDASILFGKQKISKEINLSDNEFEFDFSYVEFSNSLQFVNLAHNKIWGKLPNITEPMNTFYLDVSYNKLCGEIPQSGPWYHWANLFENNTCLCGNPLPPCSAPPPAQ